MSRSLRRLSIIGFGLLITVATNGLGQGAVRRGAVAGGVAGAIGAGALGAVLSQAMCDAADCGGAWVEGAVQTSLNAVWGIVHQLGGRCAADNPGPGELYPTLGPVALPE